MQSNLIIPLAGYGRKFSNNGYKILKPFLNIDKKNRMIDLIIKNFPKKIKKIFIVRSNLERKYINILKKYENSKIYFIKPHTNGPLYSLNSVSDKLINLKKIFISYCDINWTWIKQSKINTDYNYVFCYKGYHPFTEDNNNYAFCKTKNDWNHGIYINDSRFGGPVKETEKQTLIEEIIDKLNN